MRSEFYEVKEPGLKDELMALYLKLDAYPEVTAHSKP
jgi:hypothetical protein